MPASVLNLINFMSVDSRRQTLRVSKLDVRLFIYTRRSCLSLVLLAITIHLVMSSEESIILSPICLLCILSICGIAEYNRRTRLYVSLYICNFSVMSFCLRVHRHEAGTQFLIYKLLESDERPNTGRIILIVAEHEAVVADEDPSVTAGGLRRSPDIIGHSY